MNVLVDIGGSGIKSTWYKNGKMGEINLHTSITSYEEFTNMIKEEAGGEKIEGIAISAAGFVYAEGGQILTCKNAPYLVGNLVHKLHEQFPDAKAAVVNDGEAHARSMLIPEYNVKFGAIHLALGTAVSLGVINEKKEIIRTCNGVNWDIGDFQLHTKEEPYEVYKKLGTEGLRELETNMPEIAYHHYGCRLGSFLKTLAIIFRPSSIGLSGGIITSHGIEIMEGVREEFTDPVYSKPIQFRMMSSSYTVMDGLTTLL